MNQYLPLIQIVVGGIMLALALVLIGIASFMYRDVRNFFSAQDDLNRANSALNRLMMKRIELLEQAVFKGSVN